jgi:hypothetical protein
MIPRAPTHDWDATDALHVDKIVGAIPPPVTMVYRASGGEGKAATAKKMK